MTDKIKKVENFWNNNLCGKHSINAPYPSKGFFEQYCSYRYKKEHHLNRLLDWYAAKNKDLLEIGLGIGADGARWAKYAKTYTGIDLTDESVKATKMHFEFVGLKGRILKGDAEQLPFIDNTFDMVYSHGVLQHTPDMENSLKEIYRVLRTNGKIILMLYSKDSFNYWFRIQFYYRLRFLVEVVKYKLGLRMVEPWISHMKNFKAIG